MPDMPTLDIEGLSGLMTIFLIALGIFWGINKAIIHSKQG